ncbi:PREDICTED: membrane-spanning 4-domains subfamily A member 10 [Elephantulus edwardii]|uniref:membrane-spanning 4-domains subfamily A member 10 n=1 Tax=Elephantulus edwardii TaxID=28737 RepID=UPI0003F0E95C|nr:PREDICTED: membrane-spanning 4-domains subfamily A member 10 [Elephantulus edwardii]
MGPSQPGQTCQPWQVTPAELLPRSWHQEEVLKKRRLLQQLGVSQVFMATLHLFFGTYLMAAAKDLHLVLLKSWYPFWGAASFFFSGVAAIAMTVFGKAYLKGLCLTANLVSFFCVLAGLYVIIKDLFLESGFDDPIWGTHYTIHIQRLELALFSFTCLEFILLGPMAMVAWKVGRLSAEVDNSSLVLNPPLEFSSQWVRPPPSYEDAVRGHPEGRTDSGASHTSLPEACFTLCPPCLLPPVRRGEKLKLGFIAIKPLPTHTCQSQWWRLPILVSRSR